MDPKIEPEPTSVQEMGLLSVGVERVAVVQVSELHSDEGDQLFGDYGSSNALGAPVISIAAKDTWGRVQAQTLLHELIHAIDDIYGLELTEQAVRTLEQGLLQAIESDTRGLLGLKRTSLNVQPVPAQGLESSLPSHSVDSRH